MNLLYVTVAVFFLFCNHLFAESKTVPVSGINKQSLTAINTEMRLVKVEELKNKKRIARSSTESSGLGHLKVYIKHARNLPDTDPELNHPDPFVQVTAVYANHSSITKYTSHKDGTLNPTWNKLFDFGIGDFQCLQMSVWDDDYFLTFNDDMITNMESFTVSPGNHTDIKHCGNPSCSSYMVFDYYFALDGDECSPNPCQNGGVCQDKISSYTCSCFNSYTGTQCQYNACLDHPCLNGGTCTTIYSPITSYYYYCTCPLGYGGINCEHTRGKLQIFARNGTNLPDTDWYWNDPDPYVEVRASGHNGISNRETTDVKVGTENPKWNEPLDLGCRTWTEFTVQAYDYNPQNDDDKLTSRISYIPSIGCHNDTKICGINGCGGYIYFDYCYELC